MGIRHVQQLVEMDAYISSFSGAAYKSCMVARGVFVGFISEGAGAVDIAAAALIVEEAGGKATSLAGEALDFTKDFSGCLVSNGLVHNDLLALEY